LSRTTESQPLISIVVPTCRRAPALARCLVALEDQTLPPAHLEIIVVDDGGISSREESRVGSRFPEQVQLIRHAENSGAATARNTGARAAQAPLIAFLDDDCIPESEWAEHLLTRSTQASGAALAGEVIIGEPQLATDRVTQLLSEPVTAGDGTVIRAQSANLAIPTREFRELGGFDERYRRAGYEDYEFCLRWRAAGHRIVSVPEAVVHHMRDTTLTGFWRQHYNYGKGAYILYGGENGVPSPTLASTWQRMVKTVSDGRTLSERVRHTGLVGLSQAAMLAGFTAARLSRT
jgi:GT2 family glycosyltransferase